MNESKSSGTHVWALSLLLLLGALSNNIFAAPGDVDLTSTINWTAVRLAGQGLGLETESFARQDKFLLAAGLLDQLELQAANLSDAEKLRLSTAAREMILPNGMAASFQVLVQKKVSDEIGAYVA